jgi:hypothetical protein
LLVSINFWKITVENAKKQKMKLNDMAYDGKKKSIP